MRITELLTEERPYFSYYRNMPTSRAGRDRIVQEIANMMGTGWTASKISMTQYLLNSDEFRLAFRVKLAKKQAEDYELIGEILRNVVVKVLSPKFETVTVNEPELYSTHDGARFLFSAYARSPL